MLLLMIVAYFLKVTDSNRDHLDRLNIPIAKIYEVAYWLSIGIFGQGEGNTNFDSEYL